MNIPRSFHPPPISVHRLGMMDFFQSTFLSHALLLLLAFDSCAVFAQGPQPAGGGIDTNLKGVVYGSHAAILQFRTQGHGTLINLGSVDSVVPLAYQGVYSASKAGVLALDMALIQELRLSGLDDKIKVVTIMPWAVDTPWWPHGANYSGHTPRMASMDDPSKVVEAILHNAANPSAEVPVGWKAESGSR